MSSAPPVLQPAPSGYMHSSATIDREALVHWVCPVELVPRVNERPPSVVVLDEEGEKEMRPCSVPDPRPVPRIAGRD
eukprot:6318174-Prymnesium_polylepis.1